MVEEGLSSQPHEGHSRKVDSGVTGSYNFDMTDRYQGFASPRRAAAWPRTWACPTPSPWTVRRRRPAGDRHRAHGRHRTARRVAARAARRARRSHAQARRPGRAHRGLVLDATGLTDPDLGLLRDFFGP